MNRRQAAQVEQWAAEDAAVISSHQCLLCGDAAHAEFADGELVVWDLCDGCNGVVAATAARVAAATPLVVTGPAAAVLEHVAGQLELDDLARERIVANFHAAADRIVANFHAAADRIDGADL